MPHTQTTPDAPGNCVFVDAHVHIHDCFDIDRFLDAAAMNFRTQVPAERVRESRFVLCLTETCGANKFGVLSGRAGSPADGWQLRTDGDRRSLIAAHSRLGEMELVAGRQIVTAEKLEVLALGTRQEWDDGLPAEAVIRSVLEAGAIPVLPWGFGKWLGRRRRVIESLIETFDDGSVYLGDNGGRSAVLPTPPEFALAQARGIQVLPGSDPLPFESEYSRAGSFGFQVDGLPVKDGVWPILCAMLQRDEAKLKPFGRLESPIRFARNQIAMQYRSRFSSRKRAA